MAINLKCLLGFHQWKKEREWLYVEEIEKGEEKEIVFHFFADLRCERCGRFVKAGCFDKKWIDKHKPLGYEFEDYPGIMTQEYWRLWELTKEKIYESR